MSACRLTLLLLGALLPLAAADPVIPQFADGDRVCFVGDSITHGGFYWANVALFYACRHPDRVITWQNRGISGDYAGGALRRFDWDIAPGKPTVAVVMLGMNDVGRELYGMPDPSKQVVDQRRWNLEGYARNMAGLCDRLSGLGARLVLLTPSPYDQTSGMAARNFSGVDDALATCAGTVRSLAEARKAALVDLHGPMDALNLGAQAKDPAFTLIGPDRVHPGGPGELVMAYLLLKAQSMPATVATMAVDAASGAVATQENCRLEAVSARPDAVTFTATEAALPFPVFKHQETALALVPFTDELNREILRVTGLAAGDYTIAIDGKQVATCSATDLAAGVNLATDQQTPQYGQAMRVADSSFKRQALIARKQRSPAAAYHSWVSKAGVAPDDFAGAKRVLDPLIAKEKNDYIRGLMQSYLDCTPHAAEIAAEVAALSQRMHDDAQPKPHRYEIIQKR